MAKIKQQHIYGCSFLVPSQKYIFSPPPINAPNTGNLFPLHGREESRMRTFHPTKHWAEDTTPTCGMPKFWCASASTPHSMHSGTGWTSGMPFCLFSTVQMTDERVVRTGHLSVSFLILLRLRSYNNRNVYPHPDTSRSPQTHRTHSQPSNPSNSRRTRDRCDFV